MTPGEEEQKKFQEEADAYARNSIEIIKEWTDELDNDDEEKRDEALEMIHQDPLEVKTRTDFNGSRQYMILLGTGGPAARIIGDLNDYDEPKTARFEFQDWFKPWTKARTTGAEEQTMLEYARQFYFEEVV
ncbi:MAG: hypothetical protein QGH82_06855 [Candidatus Woesearchaeota archaeon]|jgi:hypothetical protein|nr:hypothetical protein [Candidatus Woesearchaeota archaeon]